MNDIYIYVYKFFDSVVFGIYDLFEFIYSVWNMFDVIIIVVELIDGCVILDVCYIEFF